MRVRRWQTEEAETKPSPQKPMGKAPARPMPLVQQMPNPQLDRTGNYESYMQPVSTGNSGFQQTPSGTTSAGFVPSFMMQQGSMAMSQRPEQRNPSSLYEKLQSALYNSQLPQKKMMNIGGKMVEVGKDYDLEAGY